MLIQGSLTEGRINLIFYGPEDVRPSAYSSEALPQNDCRLVVSIEEAKSIVNWLRGDHSAELHTSTIALRAGDDWLVVEATNEAFSIRLGSSALVKEFGRALSAALALNLGHATGSSDG